MSLDEGSQRNSFQPMYFVSRIKGTRDTHVLTAEEFRAKAEKSRLALTAGKPMTNFTLQERFTGGLVRPYYDWDAKHEEMPDDLEFEEKFHLREFKGVMAKLHPGARVSYAQRHGRLDVGGEYVYKISYRAFVIGLKMNVEDIPTHIRTVLGLDARAIHKHLDLSVYKSREQLVGCIYATKDTDKVKRFLVPLNPTEDVCNFLAQAVVDGDSFVDVGGSSSAPAGSGTTEKRKRGRPRKNTTATSPLSCSSFIRGNAFVSDCKEAAEAATDIFGARFRLQESFRTFAIDHEGRKLRLDTEEKWCIIRKAKHQSNNQYINIDPERGAVFRCHDDDCKSAVKGRSDLTVPWEELPRAIKDLYERTFPAPAEKDIGEDLLTDATAECQSNIVVNWPKEEGLDIRRVQEMLTAPAKAERCLNCNELIHWQHSARGLRKLCSECGLDWPVGSYLPTPTEKYPKLTQALMLLQVNVQNNVTITNNTVNILQTQDELPTDFSNDDIKAFEDEHLNSLFVASLQGLDSTVSPFAAAYHKDKFHCTPEPQWYYFHDHAWSLQANGSLYKTALGEQTFLDHYRKVAVTYENGIQTEETKRKARAIRQLAKDLGSASRRDRIVGDSYTRFKDFRPDFQDKLNLANKMAFTNGVFDFDTMTFGPGSTEDALTMRVKHAYEPYRADHPSSLALMEFFDTIQPDPACRDYLLKILGICLTNDTSQQHFYILTGRGGNGKGKLMNLLEQALGDYYQSPSPTLLTRFREAADKPNEALMSLRTARVAVFQEASGNDVIQSGTMKSFTGEDTISSRGLHGKQVKFRPRCKILWVCNELCNMDENTWAVWRRVRVIGFPINFVPDPVAPNERKANPKIDKILEAASHYLLSMLVHYYQLYLTEGLVEPPAVLSATRQYQSDLDVVELYINEKLQEEATASIVWEELTKDFREWAQASFYKQVNKWTGIHLKEEFAKHGITQSDIKPSALNPDIKRHKGARGWRFV